MSIGIGLLYLKLISLMPHSSSTEKPPEWALQIENFLTAIPYGFTLFKYLLAAGVGWFPANFAYEKIRNLWPSIELQIGPDHYQIEKARRKAIATFITLGVIPITLSFIFDLIK